MIAVETYIKKSEIKSLDNINNNFNLYFDKIKSKQELKYVKDKFYIEGAIIIKNENEYILGFEEWDLIDELYVYLIDSIYDIEINKSKTSEFYFPDQPICVKLAIYNEILVITVGKNKYKVYKNDAFKNIILESEFILNLLKNEISNNYYEDSFEKIKVLKKIFI